MRSPICDMKALVYIAFHRAQKKPVCAKVCCDQDKSWSVSKLACLLYDETKQKEDGKTCIKEVVTV